MITLENIYRDIYSRLSIESLENEIMYHDITKAINDSIRLARIRAIQKGMGNVFSTTESISNFTEDDNYPFLYSASLNKSLIPDIPISVSVLTSNIIPTNNKIQNINQTFDEGDIAIKNGNVYTALRDIQNENAYDLTFEEKNVGEIKKNNGLKYEKGDILFDGGKYYRVTTSFVEDGSSYSSKLEELVWKKKCDISKEADYYPLTRLKEMHLYDQTGSISITGKKVFATKSIKQLVLTYVPIWENVDKLTDKLDLPEFMYEFVKNNTLDILKTKLNVQHKEQTKVS